MSGGVDSSVAYILLKDSFGESKIIGATMSLFDGGGEAAEEARAVTGRFGIPHEVFDLKERFRQEVIDKFVQSYANGETPNPCVACNKYIKFGAFFEAASALNCGLMATGHYARVEYDAGSGRFLLKKAVSAKDQSYVLYNLTQEQLGRTVFPLGNLEKKQVREIALGHGLANSEKPDSQDICFIPDGDYARYIANYTGRVFEGGVIADRNGKILGRHSGIINYTVGQRKGLGLSAPTPLYVIGKDAQTNTVIAGENSELFSDRLIAGEVNWIAFGKLGGTLRLYARTRYSQPEQPCTVSPIDENKASVIFDSPQRAITPGQSVVFYDGDVVVGGGTIQSEINNC